MSIHADNPIEQPGDDSLGRAGVAGDFVAQVLSLDSSKGLVVGVLGPWGSGKTSFINLARNRLAESGVPVLEFNPWMFSGADQLVESFFVEIAAELRIKTNRADIADALTDYGEAFSGLGWLPVIGPWIERGRGGMKMLGKLLARRKEGAGGRRARLTETLQKLSKPIVVVLDDIDRLSTGEIRDIFKLVRLTASFPNVVYLVSFDRGRVEQALSEDGIPGRDYLEKILQFAVDLPAVPEEALQNQTVRAIDAAVNALPDHGPFDEELWPDVYVEVIKPLVRHMRDVRRFVAAAQGSVRSLNGRIALVDVLALEAIRVFVPDVFARLPRAAASLTTPSSRLIGGHDYEAEAHKAEIEALVTAAGEDGEVVRALVTRLFPAGSRHLPRGTHYGADFQGRWLRDRKVAHPEILGLYLQRLASDRLTAHDRAEQLFGLLPDESAFATALGEVPAADREDVIAALEAFEDNYGPVQAVALCRSVLNQLPHLPEKERGMFSYGPDVTIGLVVLRALRKLEGESAVEAAAEEIFVGVETLAARLELVETVGHVDGVGHKLVSEEAARRLEAGWREQMRAATVEDLLAEPSLLRPLLVAGRDQADGEPSINVPNDPRLTRALLEDARTETRSQSVDSRAVRRAARLAWDPLITIFGSEEALVSRVTELRQADSEIDQDLLDLFDLYAGGWRPERFH